MRKLTGAIILLTIVAFTACAGKAKDSTTEETNQTNQVKKMGTIH